MFAAQVSVLVVRWLVLDKQERRAGLKQNDGRILEIVEWLLLQQPKS